jgi:hypothetical protein
MNRTSYKKKLYLIFIIIIILAFIFGLLYCKINFNDDSYDYISLLQDFTDNLNCFHLNNLFMSIIILAISFLFSFFLIGDCILLVFIIYEFFSLGYISFLFFKIYFLKGILLSISYLIVYKTLLLFFSFLLLIVCFKISFLVYSKYILKKQVGFYDKIQLNFKRGLTLLLIIIINNIILYFWGGKILYFLSFYLR